MREIKGQKTTETHTFQLDKCKKTGGCAMCKDLQDLWRSDGITPELIQTLIQKMSVKVLDCLAHISAQAPLFEEQYPRRRPGYVIQEPLGLAQWDILREEIVAWQTGGMRTIVVKPLYKMLDSNTVVLAVVRLQNIREDQKQILLVGQTVHWSELRMITELLKDRADVEMVQDDECRTTRRVCYIGQQQ